MTGVQRYSAQRAGVMWRLKRGTGVVQASTWRALADLADDLEARQVPCSSGLVDALAFLVTFRRTLATAALHLSRMIEEAA